MQYGHFDDNAREYVIDTPATPLPWINYLGTDDFFSLISNTAGGYCFFKDAKLRRITRYRYNNVPADTGSRNYYISRMDPQESARPAETWSPTFLPSGTRLDSYRCRHGLGYSIFEGSLHGIEATLTAFVPLHAWAEINKLAITNRTRTDQTIDVTGCVEWCLWNAVDDSTNFQRNLSTGEVEIETNADSTLLYHKTEYKERRNHYAFYAVNHRTTGYDTDRSEFLGPLNGWDHPSTVEEGHAHDSKAHGWSPIAANRVRLELAPGQTQTLIFMTGYAENEPDDKWQGPAGEGIINKSTAHELFARFDTTDKVDRALDDLRSYWNGLLGKFTIRSDDAKLDRMVNIWHQYQCMVTFNMSRSASYFESGTGRGMGFRDSNQDILGFVHLIPQRARERIIDIASTQLQDGSAWHQYQPLTKQGNAEIGGGFNDDPLWLVASTYAYLAETADTSILNEPVPFNNEEGTQAPLLEHLRRSVNFTLEHRGPHHLPLIGRADWNDCLNLNCFSSKPGESFQTVENNDTGVAESIFIAGMFVLYAGQYSDILERYGPKCAMTAPDVTDEVRAVRAEVDRMKQAAESSGWDGEWFLRAYDAYSRPVGSRGNDEGKIYIEPQGMCVMAGIGMENGQAAKALTSVKERLTSEWGTAILAPAYSTYHIELGEISTYPAGYKENGGIFCHNNPWVSIANALIGNDEEAFAIYRRNCPAYVESRSDIRKVEPYVYCQMVAGPESALPGEGKNSWLTGTAAWTFVDVSQYLLGIRPTLAGLKIEPHLPRALSHVSVRRVYRGRTYDITLTRTGRRSLVSDGCAASGNVVAAADNSQEIIHVTATF
jgi:cellobiose phosphorylase